MHVILVRREALDRLAPSDHGQAIKCISLDIGIIDSEGFDFAVSVMFKIKPRELGDFGGPEQDQGFVRHRASPN